MKPLFVLLLVSTISLGMLKVVTGSYDLAVAGRIGMSAMLAFTAIGHFAFTKGMVMMLPPALPHKTGLVWITGIIELAAAVGLLIPTLQPLTGWALMMFFTAVLPANVYAATRRVDYQRGTYEGNGPAYLWFRVPLQVLFVVWTYLTAVRP